MQTPVQAENAAKPWTEQTRRGQGFISYLFNMSSGEFTPSFIELPTSATRETTTNLKAGEK